ncbi:hypothetical protein UC8_54940 [Roseimaritima ulvae]|uniref:Uncharacterized protein n=1 Tax=Roseimaritima ulvae TaxID=980254 RepID=A0A5B9R100_9BACT|nr:hypothetical protein UC8_54940 [Roseimaritima ulvae]
MDVDSDWEHSSNSISSVLSRTLTVTERGQTTIYLRAGVSRGGWHEWHGHKRWSPGFSRSTHNRNRLRATLQPLRRLMSTKPVPFVGGTFWEPFGPKVRPHEKKGTRVFCSDSMLNGECPLSRFPV